VLEISTVSLLDEYIRGYSTIPGTFFDDNLTEILLIRENLLKEKHSEVSAEVKELDKKIEIETERVLEKVYERFLEEDIPKDLKKYYKEQLFTGEF
jgi:hypothetical protein